MYESILINFAKDIILNDNERAFLLERLELKEYKKKDKVLVAGTTAKELNFVVEGCLRIYHVDESGKEHSVSFFPEGWWATDLESFYAKTPAFYSIDALEDSKIIKISHAKIEELYNFSPNFERFFRILTQKGYIIYQRRMTAALFQSAETRYRNFQNLFPTLENRISKKLMASYLGITPEFLSLLRKNHYSKKKE
jgi:CRP-like cAMP-binding protein